MEYISVAIDGPAGAGKSSVAKKVAKDLGFIYVDTGAMYRSVALYAIRNNIKPSDEASVKERIDDIDITIKYIDGVQHIYLNGVDVSDDIRTPEVSMGASDVAKIGVVREKLVSLQRNMAKVANIIMDGRDICTTVLPDAQVKLFLTASVDARAKRRYDEMTQKGMLCEYEEIKKDIISRDKNDSERKISPLKKADDAKLLDTSDMSFDEVVDTVKNEIKEHGYVL